MGELNRTVLYPRHAALGAKMIEFGGWEMPVLYSAIVAEHLATRKTAGLFDISHMGRFGVSGRDPLPFLQHVLSNNAAALDVGEGQYTLIPTETGGAVDDAYLYRFVDGEYLLVVNAANREKDLAHLRPFLERFGNVQLADQTDEIAMLSIQGPRSRAILLDVIESGSLPEPRRNKLSIVSIAGVEVRVSRTGYTGEPLCFELFADRDAATKLWDLFIEKGATPAGLGARDTLRLEAGLPLYGNELGTDPDQHEIPIYACPSARPSVSFSPLKGDYVGRAALLRQHDAYSRIIYRDYSLRTDLPGMLQSVALTGLGVVRGGAKVFKDGAHVGYVTSGTMAPYWEFEGDTLHSAPTEKHQLRAICLAYVLCDVIEDDELSIESRGRGIPAVVVPYHLRAEAPPYARPIVYGRGVKEQEERRVDGAAASARRLLDMAVANTSWRQRQCINLIPSEMTPSPLVRMLSVADPAFRYAEHKQVKAFYDAEVFYYQGIDFIAEVERLLNQELRKFLGCPEVESRITSGQMANTAVFSAMLDYLNRADRKREPRRIGCVMNNDIVKGGHLSAQPMGALRDYVARDPRTERPAVVNFPVLADNPFRIDVPAACELIDQYPPELIIFGKSMVLHKEPVSEIKQFLDQRGLNPVVMYDMAHVLGLIGPHFQRPFAEGADFVTGSTHKTFFGTQRGVIGCRYTEQQERYELWEAVLRRTFPGSVSNHHLGTMVGLLLAAYEMNHFKDEYQRKVIQNAKSFAKALEQAGLSVAGDPSIDYTETHQVIVDVGYARGPEMAQRLEASNIISNYQAAPWDDGFSAASCLRMGVAEMTRFGMEADDFGTLAGLIADVVLRDLNAKDAVAVLRSRFLDLGFCFGEEELGGVAQQVRALL